MFPGSGSETPVGQVQSCEVGTVPRNVNLPSFVDVLNNEGGGQMMSNCGVTSVTGHTDIQAGYETVGRPQTLGPPGAGPDLGLQAKRMMDG